MRAMGYPVNKIYRIAIMPALLAWMPVSFQKKGANVEAGKAGDKNETTGGESIQPQRNPGKAGWFAGIHSTPFRSRFVGVGYGAPKNTLTWEPLPALGDFQWQYLRFGDQRFGLKLAQNGKDPHVTVTNSNMRQVTVRLRLPARDGMKLFVFGKPQASHFAPCFGEPGIASEFTVPAGGSVSVSLIK